MVEEAAAQLAAEAAAERERVEREEKERREAEEAAAAAAEQAALEVAAKKAADAAANAAEEATKEFTAPPTTAITEEVAVASLPCTVVEVDVESVEEDTVVRASAMEAAWVSSVEAADTVLEAAVRAAEDAVEEEEEEEDPEPLPTPPPPPPVVPPLSVPEEERVVAVAVKEEMVMGTPTLYKPTPPAVVPNSPVTTVPDATPGPVTGDPTAMGAPPTLGDTEVTVMVVPLMVAV